MTTQKTILALLIFSYCAVGYSQINIKDKVKEKSTDRAESHIDKGIDKGLDKVEEGVGKLFGNDESKDTASSGDEKAEQGERSESGGETSDVEKEKSCQSSQVITSYTKYDFVPGDKIIYYEDFSRDAIGDFPALWTTNGGGEVKTISIDPGHWFHMNKEDAVYCYTKQVPFPDNFIMEFDIIPDGDFSNGFTLTFYQEEEFVEMNDDLYPGSKGLHITFELNHWYTKGYDNSLDAGGWAEGGSQTNPVVESRINHVIIWVQGRRLRIYHKGAKVLDMPTNIYSGVKFNRFRFSGWSTYSTPYISYLKITTAAPDTRNKLLTEGKLICYGISFDVNSDAVKPESFGTLKDISVVLKDNPSLKMKIIGHTDSDGDDAKNLDLSKRRALSVKGELVKEFGVDGTRILTDGKGETEPLVPETTSLDKAKNRRVEFVRLN